MLTAMQPRDPWAPPYVLLPLSCYPSSLRPLSVGPGLCPLIFFLWDCSQKMSQSTSDLCPVFCSTLIFCSMLWLWLWFLLLWSTGMVCCLLLQPPHRPPFPIFAFILFLVWSAGYTPDGCPASAPLLANQIAD